MAVRYVKYGGVRASKLWAEVLSEADRVGVRFHVTSGHRTPAAQQALFNQNMHYVAGVGWVPRPGHPLTAVPSATAPHIRSGRPDHAIDVDALDGGVKRLAAWLRTNHVSVSFPVAREPWHLEANRGGLERLRKSIRAANRRRALKARRASEIAAAAKFIAPFEDFRARAYKPVAAEKYFTIGYGHYGPDVRPDAAWTKARALVVLARDVARYYDGVVAQFPNLNRNQRVAITSAVFNLGLGVLASDRSLGRALRARRGVGAALALYVKGADGEVLAGLVRRRNVEAARYVKPVK